MKKRRRFVTLVLPVSLALAPSAQATLLGWWKMDATAGTVVKDSSGNGYDGALFGTPQ